MTRIIAGEFRGRRLSVPTGKTVRPTTDRMRERVFSMLQHSRYPDLVDGRVADVFAGTGALGLEALSRGAAHTCFVEKSSRSLQHLEANIKTLQVQDRTSVLRCKATEVPKAQMPFSHIFMDPPYGRDLLSPSLKACMQAGWLESGTVLVCELGADEDFDPPGKLSIVDDRTQGAQRILFLIAN